MKIIEFNSRGKTHYMKVDDDFTCDKNIRIDKDGYAIIAIKRVNTGLHRVIMNAPKGTIVDHINRDKLDNRKCNLRLVTHKQNSANKKAKGAYYYEGMGWKTHYYDNVTKKTVHLGYFKTKEEAQEVYQKKHIEMHGEYSPYFNK